jgi:hypothetical protein
MLDEMRRDGAFVGRWESPDPAAGESTIQCKFTSQPDRRLSLSLIAEELDKVRALVAKRLATDYIILTNHPITGASELQIKAAFEQAGVGRCRIFGYDWIVRQIRSSPRLRMLAPRLYGLGDLTESARCSRILTGPTNFEHNGRWSPTPGRDGSLP